MAAKAAWRLDDLPAVAREMEAVREESVRIGDKNLEGKALTALADMVLMREADPIRARELAEEALALIGDDPPARFDALRVAWNAAYWVGHLADAEHYVVEQLELAREAGRKDLESVAILTWADTYLARLDLETARAKMAHARELAEESGAINSRGRVYLSWRKIYLLQDELEQAEACLAEAERLFSEAGAVWAVARTLNMSAWVAWESGDLTKAEKRFRESIRLLKPLGDRATLCESQRGLAELLIARGRIEEAERLRARGSRDSWSAGRHVTRDNGRLAGPGAGRAGPRRGGRGALPGGCWPPSPTRTSARSSTRCSARTFSSCATEDATTTRNGSRSASPSSCRRPRTAPPESPDVTPRPGPR